MKRPRGRSHRRNSCRRRPGNRPRHLRGCPRFYPAGVSRRSREDLRLSAQAVRLSRDRAPGWDPGAADPAPAEAGDTPCPEPDGPAACRRRSASQPARTPPARQQLTQTKARRLRSHPRGLRSGSVSGDRPEKALVQSMLGRRWGPATATPPRPSDSCRPGAASRPIGPPAGGQRAGLRPRTCGPLPPAARGESESGSNPLAPSLPPSSAPRSRHARISA